MEIGSVKLENNIIMAPMAGVTDKSFRTICKEYGAGLVCTEMVSAKGLYYGDKKTEVLMDINQSNRPVSLQIFGSDPDIMEKVVLEKLNHLNSFDILDINMGCPAPKIVNNGDGSALMKTMSKAKEIMKRVKKASNKPVTVKIRKGWNEYDINYLQVGLAAEECGIDAITIHGRTRSQFYSGEADWEPIKELKKRLSIKVIGNGDIYNCRDAEKMLDYTGCDGVMIARGALGNPWIFKEIYTYLKKGEIVDQPGYKERLSVMRRHLELMIEEKSEKVAVLQMRKHCGWYVKGFKGASEMRSKLNMITSKRELEELIEKYTENVKKQQ
jgi:tRNA-dihydrouridine synthase B